MLPEQCTWSGYVSAGMFTPELASNGVELDEDAALDCARKW